MPLPDESNLEKAVMRDLYCYIHDHVEGVVQFGDTKATLLIAADSLLVAAYLTGADKLNFFSPGIDSSARVFGIVSLALLGLGLVLALLAATPSPSHWVGKNGTKGVLLYSSIADYKKWSDYLKELQRLGDEGVFNEMVRRIHSKSIFAHKKFTCLFLSSTSTCLSLVMAATAILLKALPIS